MIKLLVKNYTMQFNEVEAKALLRGLQNIDLQGFMGSERKTLVDIMRLLHKELDS